MRLVKNLKHRKAKTYRHYLGFGLMVLALSGCFEKEEGDQMVTKHLKQAEFYLKQGQYKAANIEVRNAMQKDPRSLEGVVLNARIMIALGYHNQVIEILEPLKDKLNAEGLFTLVESYLGRTKFRSAFTLLNEKQALLESEHATRFLLNKGHALAGLGNVEQALTAYQQVLQLDAGHVEAALGEVRVLTFLDKSAERDKKLSALKEKAPNDADVLIFEARLLASQNDLEGAEKALTAALSLLPSTDELTPRRAGVISLLADILSKQKRSAEALRYSRILSEAYPGMDELRGRYQEALALFKDSKFAEAEEILQAIIEQSPGFESAGQLLGVINFLQGDHSEADHHFASTLDPELASDEVKQIYAMNSMRMRRPEEVIATLKPGLQDSKNASLWAMYGVAAYSAGFPEDAVDAMEKSIELDPKNARTHLVLARYMINGAKPDVEKGVSLLEKAYALAPKDVMVQQALLQQYIREDDRKAADALAEELAQTPDAAPQTFVLLGDFALLKGNQKQAVTLFDTALEKAPQYEQAAAKLAGTYVKSGQTKKAQALYEKWKQSKPNSTWPYTGLLALTDKTGNLQSLVTEFEALAEGSDGEVSAPLVALGSFYLAQRKFDQAVEYAEKARKFAKEHPELDRLVAASYYALGSLAIRAQKFDEARGHILKALQAIPESTPLLIALAEVEVGTGNIAEARKIIEQVKQIDKATGFHLEGDLKLAEKNPGGAQQSYEESWSLKPTDALALRMYSLYVNQKDQGKAQQHLVDWLTLFPNSPRARSINGTTYLAKKDYKQAEQEFKLGLQGDPNSVVLLNNLAWVMQQLKKPEAEAYAKKAAQLAPQAAAVLDTYGWILFENGKPEQAKPILKKALELAPENKEIQEHYAAVEKVFAQ